MRLMRRAWGLWMQTVRFSCIGPTDNGDTGAKTFGRRAAVILSAGDFDSITETLGILSDQELMREVRAAETEAEDRVTRPRPKDSPVELWHHCMHQMMRMEVFNEDNGDH